MATSNDLPRNLDELCERVKAAVAAGRHDVVARFLIDNVRRTLNDDWESGRREDFAKLLKAHQQFGYARRLYRQVYEGAGAVSDEVRQQYALCVYKDLELPASRRYERALEILGEGGPVAGWSAESLGLAGAVYKRLWQAEAKLADLQNAHSYYAEGFTREGDDQRLYCGVNAAFALDQIASVDQTGRLGSAPQAGVLRRRADEIRMEIATELDACDGELDMWDTATLAEARFGLGEDFPAAAAALADYVELGPTGGERETTASQLAELARLRGFGLSKDDDRSHAAQFADSDAAKALHVVVGGDAEALLRRAYLGKIGIALSGGGYRASLFHIGVLARLAERDVLRGVEVLSCVSGGSILGAFYYLRVRELLQARGDDAITAGDYVELVQKLADDFLRAVQSNARVRLTGSVKDNWKMAARSDYSRTDRVAELFETLIYSQVKKDGDGDWRMDDLLIKPSGREGFSPRYDNWERQARVPILVLNATALNTGHSWQFTASWMGEPPDVLDERVDANPRLRRMYYADAPKAFREAPPRLADAVAASACVPGLFPPIQLDGVYDGISVRLVDGGVHDNQGVASLVEQECAVMLVSDASGQMSERTDPGRGLLSVANRSNSILMSRVRAAQLADLGGRRRAGALRRLMVVHLKKGLPAPPTDWGQEPDDPCPEPYRPELDERAAVEATSEEDYKISVGVQRALAEIRTDLDSFSDIEAYALMAAGYKMAGHELGEQLEDFPEVFDERPEWPFEHMLARLATPLESDRELEVALVVGKERFGKPLRAWWRRRSRGPGRMGKAVRKVTHGLGRGAELAATPVRAVVAAPVSLIGAAGTRVYLATLGHVRRNP